MKYSSYYTYQKYCNIGGQGMIPVYPNVYSIDADETLQKRLHKKNNGCCSDLPAIYRTTSGSPYCDSSYNKCVDSYTEISYDNGETWEFYSSGTTIVEYDSEYCRAFRWVDMDINTDYWCEPCSGTQTSFKVRGYTSGNAPYSATCNNSTLIYSDIPTNAVTVEIGDCVTEIDEKAFYYEHPNYYNYFLIKPFVNNVYIPSSVESIPASAFTNMTSLVSCTLPETLTRIGDGAFWGCVQLSNLDLWDNITYIDNNAFNNCDSLTSIHIPSGLTTIAGGCFNGCGALTSIDIPDNITSIGVNAFEGCGIERLTIGNGTENIYNQAFLNCSKLKYVTIGDGTTYIGSRTFSGCSEIINCTIGSGITYIDIFNFVSCNNMESITIKAITPPTLNILYSDGSGRAFRNTNDCPIYVPCISVDLYKKEWPYYASRIQAIPNSTCGKVSIVYSGSTLYYKLCDSNSTLITSDTKPDGYDYTLMEVANIGNCVTSIGNSAFENCSRLSACTIPSTVTSIDYYAFYKSGLKEVTIPDSVTSIGLNAFRETKLTGCTIGSGNTDIGQYAFYGCSGLTSANIQSGNIGYGAFNRCTSLSSLTIGSGVTSIGNSAFYKCSGLTSVDIPDSVTSIGEYAFYDCSKSGNTWGYFNITIGSGITSIGNYAFAYIDRKYLSLYIYATTPPTLGTDVFKNSNISDIYVPSGSVNAYKTAPGWSDYAEDITSI